jgi:hypothetical protein
LARALLAEPRLAAATRLEEAGSLIDSALARLERLEGVPLGWRAAVVEQVRSATGLAVEEQSDAVELTLEIDALGSSSLSLYVFRRRPAVLPVLSVQLWAERASTISAPGALTLRETSPKVLRRGCRLAD